MKKILEISRETRLSQVTGPNGVIPSPNGVSLNGGSPIGGSPIGVSPNGGGPFASFYASAFRTHLECIVAKSQKMQPM